MLSVGGEDVHLPYQFIVESLTREQPGTINIRTSLVNEQARFSLENVSLGHQGDHLVVVVKVRVSHILQEIINCSMPALNVAIKNTEPLIANVAPFLSLLTSAACPRHDPPDNGSDDSWPDRSQDELLPQGVTLDGDLHHIRRMSHTRHATESADASGGSPRLLTRYPSASDIQPVRGFSRANGKVMKPWVR